MDTKTYSIHDIASEFDRLFASDASEISWGHGTQAGHIGHERDEASTVGWYCDGGNAGNPVVDIGNADIQRAWEVLDGLAKVRSIREIEAAFAKADIQATWRY